MIFSHSSRIRILHINFGTRLFLLGGFINNRKTSSGPILFTDIELHVESYIVSKDCTFAVFCMLLMLEGKPKTRRAGPKA